MRLRAADTPRSARGGEALYVSNRTDGELKQLMRQIRDVGVIGNVRTRHAAVVALQQRCRVKVKRKRK